MEKLRNGVVDTLKKFSYRRYAIKSCSDIVLYMNKFSFKLTGELQLYVTSPLGYLLHNMTQK